jgi:hypothetical protein
MRVITPSITSTDLPRKREKDFTPVPDGIYSMKIATLESGAADIRLKTSKAGNEYLAVRLQHVTPEFSNRGAVWANVMIQGEYAAYSSNLGGLIAALGFDSVPSIVETGTTKTKSGEEQSIVTFAFDGDPVRLGGLALKVGLKVDDSVSKNEVNAFISALESPTS